MSKASTLAQTIAIGALLLVPAYAFWSWLGQHPAPVAIALPQGAAVFETSLQSRISPTDTSMSLVANSVRGGSSLSGYNCFTIDEGRSDRGNAFGVFVVIISKAARPH